MRFLLFTVLCLILAVAADEAISSARLLIGKKVLNKYLVEGKDIIIHYNIYNVGESAAVDVNINDGSLPLEYFEVVGGINSFTVPRVGPGENLTHTVVYRSKTNVWGRFNISAGDVSYFAREDDKTPQLGATSEPGEGFVVSQSEFDRRFSSHTLDWFAFAVMSLPSLLIPFHLWYKSHSKYTTAPKQTKNKAH